MEASKNNLKKDRFKRALLVNLIVPLLLVFVLVSIFGFYYHNQKQELIEDANTVAVDSTDRIVTDLSSTLELAQKSIKTISASVSKNMEGPELTDPEEAIEPLAESSPFDSIEYIRADGMDVMSVAGPFDASDREYYIQGIKGNTGIWNNYHPKSTEDTLMNFYTPLLYDDQPVGVITGYIRANAQIGPLLNVSLYGQTMDCVLFDKDGMVASSSLQTDFVKDYTIGQYLEDAGFSSDQNEKLEKLLSDETDGCVSFEEESGQGRLCVKAIPDTNMFVAVIIPASSMNAVIKNFMEPTTHIFMVLFAVLFAYAIFLIFNNRRENELLLSEKNTLEEAEKGQRQALQAFESVHDALGSANWQMNFDENGKMTDCIWSSRFRKLIGYKGMEDFPDVLSSWSDLLHPEDKEKTLKAYWAAVNDRTGKTIYNVHYRLMTKAGVYRWYSAQGSLTRYDNGMAKIFYGLFLDINDRVVNSQLKEEQLQEITALNDQLQENQTKLEEASAEQEAQLEEIAALNTQLESNQAELEASVAEQESQIVEITELNHSLADYSDAMTNAGYGLWHIILKNGSNPRMQVNDKMAELLGVAGKNLSEEELYNAWYDNIVPDAVPSVQASVGEMMDGHFSENTYQWVHPTKGVIYVRCGGTAGKLEDGSDYISGYHADVTDIVYEEKKHNEELEEARRKAEEEEKQVSAAYGMIEGLSQDYHTIWLVDKETSRMQLIRSSGVSTIQNAVQMGKDLPEFDKGFDKYINTYVEPEDRERMHKEIAFSEILHQLEINPKKLYAVNYLRRDDSGHVGYHQIAFANADTKEGKKQFVYGFRDVDQLVKEEQKQKEELKKLNMSLTQQVDVIGGLSNAYFVCYSGNLNTGEFTEVKQLEIVHDILKNCHTIEDAFACFIPLGVASEDLERMREFVDISTLPERLKYSDTISLEYHGRIKYEWNRASWIVAKRDENGKAYGVLYVVEEITGIVLERKRQEDELKQARDQAEAANKAKSSFLFNMSHDIRTPMNAIIGYANLMKRNQHNMEKWPDYLDKVLASSDFLLGLINNVLEMARIESGKMVLDENVYAADAFIDQVYSVFADEMGKKDLKFTKSIDVKHKYFYSDTVKLREIILNIVSNAQKYTLPGGSVDLSVKELSFDLDDEYALIQTTVSDTGIGMSEEFLPHIFEEFTREKNSSGNKIQGTGLGMPIVKKLVDLMGGTIEVQSKVGEGSTFIVTIPHRIAEKPTEVEKTEKIDYSEFEGKRILLAEDNDLNAEIAMEILSEFNFNVERAEDGVVCVDMLNKAEAGYYDVILMDIQMPNLDGYGATRKIRDMNDLEKADIPIIAMTANAFDEDKRNAIDAGMDGHVAKPIEIPTLMRTLANIFKDRSSFKNIIFASKQREDPVTHVKKIYFEMQRSKAVSVLPGGFFAYMAEQPEKLIFANELCCSIWGCKNFEEFNDLVGESFKGIVHPDDYDRVEKEIWHQIDQDDAGLDKVKYRIIKKDGTVSHVDDYGRLVKDKEVGDIFYVFVAETKN